MTSRVGASLWIFSAVVYFAAEAYASTGMPSYGYATDYISTLGDPPVSPHAAVMNAAFVVQAVAFPLGGWLLVRGDGSAAAWAFRILGLCNGVGNVLVAAVHSGSASPWHGVGAGLAIGGGNLAVVAGAWSVRSVSRATLLRVVTVALGAIGLLCLPLLPWGVEPIGLWERVSVYSIYAWQVLAALAFFAGERRAARA